MSFAFTPLEQSLLRLALDPAAAQGEIFNSGAKLMLLLRRRGVGAAEVLQYSVQNTEPGPFRYGEVKIQFGKYKGLRLREIDPGYLRWVHGKCRDNHPELCRAISWFMVEAGYWGGESGHERN
jgi:uncharacterized protein (DUF3820 family)